MYILAWFVDGNSWLTMHVEFVDTHLQREDDKMVSEFKIGDIFYFTKFGLCIATFWMKKVYWYIATGTC